MSNVFELGFSQSDAEIQVKSLPVTGRFPDWLQGTLLRNGPGTLRVGEQRYRHWFDGLAMLHRFAFINGQVSYANKFLESNAYREARETGRIAYSEFATDPCRSFFSRVMTVFSPKITDSAKVNLTQVAGQFMALAETPIQIEFDPETLESVGVFSYEDNLQGQMTTVHPHFDYEQDIMYNVVTRFHRISHYRLYGLHHGGGPRLIGQVPVKKPSYMHSFGMSQNYAILCAFPMVVNPLDLLLWLRPFIENFSWKPRMGAPFIIINRHTGELVGQFESDPFFAFHHINAFEQGDELVVDICAYPDAEVLDSFYMHRLEDPQNEIPFGNLRRYRIPLRGKRATYETISDACLELPRFDYERLNMNAGYRYVYGVGIHPAHRQGFYNQITKIDIATGNSYAWYQDGCYPGEPVFVGAPDRRDEDEGVLLSVVLDSDRGTSFLLVLDARSLDEVARAEIPHPVLFGYHGDYFPGERR
jgi:beta,beta-carotene 9',10'-dioxygenase